MRDLCSTCAFFPLLVPIFNLPRSNQGLDQLSHWLRNDEYFGFAVLFGLIFITTFRKYISTYLICLFTAHFLCHWFPSPTGFYLLRCLSTSTAPLPLYSTLITLSGYTYGPWIGAMISYSAALSGAIVVFSLSRAFLREQIARWLQSTRGLCRVVRAIERKPQLLFLVRLAPYPYNVMNVLLASTTLNMKTYVTCTGLSLFKVIVHTSIGAGIRSFSAHKSGSGEEHGWSRLWTIVGIALCVALFLYLSWVARRAVDDELEDEIESSSGSAEEQMAFLTADARVEDEVSSHPYERLPSACRSRESMSEAQLASHPPIVSRHNDMGVGVA